MAGTSSTVRCPKVLPHPALVLRVQLVVVKWVRLVVEFIAAVLVVVLVVATAIGLRVGQVNTRRTGICFTGRANSSYTRTGLWY
jgi:hypothetical protein